MITGEGFKEGACVDDKVLVKKWNQLLEANPDFSPLSPFCGTALLALELHEAATTPPEDGRITAASQNLVIARAQQLALIRFMAVEVSANHPGDISNNVDYRDYQDVVFGACDRAKEIAHMATHVHSDYFQDMLTTINQAGLAMRTEDCFIEPQRKAA